MNIVEVTTIMGSLLSFIAILGAVLFYHLNKKEAYRNDSYRIEQEKKMYELYRELIISRKRFEDVNHLLIDWNKNQKKNTNNNNFFEGLGIEIDSIEIDKSNVFVLAPFHPMFDDQYSAIKETVEKLGLNCSRGDDSTKNENILAHIVFEICRSNLIIANISGKNPNVFYELGIAQALGKKIIIVAESESDVPFDLSSNRLLLFTNTNQLRNRLKKWLVNSLL